MQRHLYRVEIGLLDGEQADVIVAIVTHVDDVALKWAGVVKGIHAPTSGLKMCARY
ncbi:hypothetical protein B738_26812 [Photorhabdus temperata subsp. temperata M1021]|nr:hypothetical protein B738_26812 [Photorhabdus temperata subsp. temperata M1021]